MGQSSPTVYACPTRPPNVLGDALLYASTKLSFYVVCLTFKSRQAR